MRSVIRATYSLRIAPPLSCIGHQVAVHIATKVRGCMHRRSRLRETPFRCRDDHRRAVLCAHGAQVVQPVPPQQCDGYARRSRSPNQWILRRSSRGCLGEARQVCAVASPSHVVIMTPWAPLYRRIYLNCRPIVPTINYRVIENCVCKDSTALALPLTLQHPRCVVVP